MRNLDNCLLLSIINSIHAYKRDPLSYRLIIKQQFNDHSSKYHFISLFSPINKIAIHSKDTPHRNKINNEELRSNKNLIKQMQYVYSKCKNDSIFTINKFHDQTSLNPSFDE